MINIIDIVIGALILIYLVKNFGGIFKTLKSIVIIICALIIFGIVTSFIVDWPILGAGRQYLKDSFVVNLSYNIIKTIYPTIENGAPKVNSYIKDKIMSTQTSTPELPSIPAVEKMMPKMAIPAVPELQLPLNKK
ncbi:MAG: hypothetical protein WC890_03130 [Candidatus Margulisiibacteriota bacterium]